MGKVYVIISGKGGVGKTTSTINLGFCMNEAGREVIIVDANLTTPNLGIHLGSPIVPITLNHVMAKQAQVEEAIYEHESGTKVLPSSLSMADMEKVDTNKLPEIAKKLRKISENVLLDSAAGLGEEARAAIESADEIIVITNPEVSAVTDALKAIKLSEEMGKKVSGVVITRKQGKKWEMPIDSIKDMLEVPILGVVPEDDAIKESQRIKNAVVVTHPKSPSARSYRNITERILGNGKSKLNKLRERKDNRSGGVFKRILGKIFRLE
jgi:septum site-determining protein MinD